VAWQVWSGGRGALDVDATVVDALAVLELAAAVVLGAGEVELASMGVDTAGVTGIDEAGAEDAGVSAGAEDESLVQALTANTNAKLRPVAVKCQRAVPILIACLAGFTSYLLALVAAVAGSSRSASPQIAPNGL
jgi:hypothetical protein